MEYWPQVKIGDVCIVERGGSPRPIDKYITDSEDGINWIKIGDTDDSMYITSTAQKIIPEGAKKSRYVQPGDFLLSNSMSFGRPYILKIDGCIHDGWLVLRDKNGLFDKRFLYYYLSAPVTYQKFKSLAVGGVVNNLNSEMVRNVEVPLPALNEQAQIATVLDKLSGLISLRKQQLAKLDELVKARFVEMFGDLKRNNMNWPSQIFADFAIIDTTMVHDFEKYSDYPHIGIDSIEKETGKLLDFRSVKEDGIISGKYLFTPKHIIYSKIRPNLNKVALPDFTGVCSADAYPILPKEGTCNREFLAYTLRSPVFLDYILAFSNRTNLPKVNKQQVEGFCCPIPDWELQEKFATFYRQVNGRKLTIQQSLDKLEVLKKSLMQKYFG